MSGGEQQMLAVARTLMTATPVLLLDEPCEVISPVLVARVAGVGAARIEWGDPADLSLCDVVIDFSTAEASVALAQAAAERGGPALVIGSTGFTREQEAELEKAGETIAIVKSGNFSLGVNILIGLVQHAAQRLDAQDWDIEITEAHHRRKVDSPSGTALMLGEAAAEGRPGAIDPATDQRVPAN
jgi:4-hydroxy-tetrahydrodipicolinate reductase